MHPRAANDNSIETRQTTALRRLFVPPINEVVDTLTRQGQANGLTTQELNCLFGLEELPVGTPREGSIPALMARVSDSPALRDVAHDVYILSHMGRKHLDHVAVKAGHDDFVSVLKARRDSAQMIENFMADRINIPRQQARSAILAMEREVTIDEGPGSAR